jgi:hypothetical protein
MQPNHLGFLHRHPDYEQRMGLDDKHVVVDREDWEAVRRNQCPPPGFVALSRRNLLTLLHMLDDPESSKVLHKPTPAGKVMVTPVTDEEAYRNRMPGPMRPAHEQFIRLAEKALKEVLVQMNRDENPPLWAFRAAGAVEALGSSVCGGCNGRCRSEKTAAAIAAARDSYFAEAGCRDPLASLAAHDNNEGP